MPYTAPEIILMVGAIGAQGALLIGAWRTSGKIDKIVDKTDAIHTVSETIHETTNSASTALTALNTSLQAQNQILRDQLSAQQRTAELLAQGVQAREQSRLIADALHATPESGA